jgi:hypothetical protein
MHITFVEKVLADGNFEISIVEGSKELKKAISGEYTFPKKLILTKEQKKENKDGLKDLLTGAFCIQDIENVTFTVTNEKGSVIDDYSKSLYDDVGTSGNA